MVKISLIFVAFLENLNFKNASDSYQDLILASKLIQHTPLIKMIHAYRTTINFKILIFKIENPVKSILKIDISSFFCFSRNEPNCWLICESEYQLEKHSWFSRHYCSEIRIYLFGHGYLFLQFVAEGVQEIGSQSINLNKAICLGPFRWCQRLKPTPSTFSLSHMNSTLSHKEFPLPFQLINSSHTNCRQRKMSALNGQWF